MSSEIFEMFAKNLHVYNLIPTEDPIGSKIVNLHIEVLHRIDFIIFLFVFYRCDWI